jgi:hypothetical protein
MMIDNFDSANAGDVGNEEIPNLNPGAYTSLRVEKMKIFQGTKPGKTHAQYFKCVFTVVNAENGHNAGDIAQMFETVSGSGYPHFDAQAVARVKKLLGSIAGLKTDAEITAQVSSKDLALATSDAQPFKGSIVSAVVGGKDPRFPKAVCSPAEGTVAIKAPVPPTVDHTARAKTLGWLPHPSAPGFHYLGQSVKSDLDIAAGNF